MTSILAILRAADIRGAATIPAVVSTRRNLTSGEIDAIMRRHRITVRCFGSLFNARQCEGRFSHYSRTGYSTSEALLKLVEVIEGR